MRRVPTFKLFAAVILSFSVLGAARLTLAMAPQASAASALEQGPMSQKEVVDLVKHNKKNLASVEPILESRGVDFEVTPDVEKSIRKAGATDEFMAVLQKATPSARAAAAKAKGQAAAAAAAETVTREEGTAYQAIRNELDPDRQVKLAEDFEQKYPKSQLLTFVYAFEASAYQQKNDAKHAVEFAEKSLQLKPDNLLSLLIASTNLATPQEVNDLTDADKAKKLDEAEQDANQALQIIGKIPKAPNETDDAFQKRQNGISSGAYSALGMVHLERAEMGLQGPDKEELAKAEQAYSTAVKDSQAPYAPDYYRLGEVMASEGKLDGAIDAYTKAASAAQGSQIATLAQEQIQKLKQEQKSAGPAAKQ